MADKNQQKPQQSPAWLEDVVSLDQFENLARSRRMCRAFKTDPIPDEVLEQILEVANSAPSAANAQPWEFVVVRDDELKEGLFEIFIDELDYKQAAEPRLSIGGNTQEFKDAPVTVVIVGDKRFKCWYPAVEDGSREKLYHHSMAACVQNFHLAAASAGLGTTWVSCRGPSQYRVKELLDIPHWCHIASVAPLGYPDEERVPSKKTRMEVKRKIHDNSFNVDLLPDTEEVWENSEKIRRTGESKREREPQV